MRIASRLLALFLLLPLAALAQGKTVKIGVLNDQSGLYADLGGQGSVAAAKMAAKRVDLMVANDVTAPGSGFEVDTNRAVLIAPDGTADQLPQMPKIQLADAIWDRVAVALARRAEEAP